MRTLLAESGIPASEKLSTFTLWDWLIDRDPGTGFWIMLFISPVFLTYVIRPAVEGRITRFSDDFLTFRMDAMLAPAFGCALALVDSMQDRQYIHPGALNTIFQVLVIVFWIGFGAFHMWSERMFYRPAQWLSPSALYHNGVLYILVGYALTMVGVMGLIFAPWDFAHIVLRVVMLLSASTWALSWPLYDAKRKQNPLGESKFELAHVDDGWPWQHKYQYLGAWFVRYLEGWETVPARARALFARLTA